MQRPANWMQHGTATPVQQPSLKSLAIKVLARNTRARQPYSNAPDDVLQRGPAENSPQQHHRNTPALRQLPTRINERGELVLIVAALPALAERLRLQGWKVTRKSNELICK